MMSEMDDTYGRIIFQDAGSVIRACRKSDGMRVYVHAKDAEGRECLPRGYVAGVNFLRYTDDEI